MLKQAKSVSPILYARIFISLIPLVALFFQHLWGESHIHVRSQEKEKQTQRGLAVTSLQPPACTLSCNCNAPLQYLLKILTEMMVKSKR